MTMPVMGSLKKIEAVPRMVASTQQKIQHTVSFRAKKKIAAYLRRPMRERFGRKIELGPFYLLSHWPIFIGKG